MSRAITTRFSKVRWLIPAIAVSVCFVAGAVDAPSVPDEGADPWSLPAWVANDQVIRGTFANGATPLPQDVRIRYQLNEGEARDAQIGDLAHYAGSIEFTLPKLGYDSFGFIHLWAENSRTGEPITNARTIAIADWHEFDITGQTAVEMLFPMKSWRMQVRFTPCCLILGGYLRVERIPVNPMGKTDGLPDVLASHFLQLAPDPTVVATSGLNADIEIDRDSVYANSPEDVTVYRWFKGKWTPVLGASLHAETNTIRFKALEGGYFVLAPRPVAHP